MQLKILQFKHHVVCAALLLVSLWQNLHSFPGRRDSARQNVSPEGQDGGEDEGPDKTEAVLCPGPGTHDHGARTHLDNRQVDMEPREARLGSVLY